MTQSFFTQNEAVAENPRRSRKAAKAPSAFRTISEVAEELDVQQHVLRFWETKFSQVRPLKRGGGRRYYRPEDVTLLKRIHHLLYTEGYTIKGAQKLLKGQGKAQIAAAAQAQDSAALAPKTVVAAKPSRPPQVQGSVQSLRTKVPLSAAKRAALEEVLAELRDIRGALAK